MHEERLTLKEKENKNLTIIIYHANTIILNSVKEKYYPFISSCTSSTKLSKILNDYNKFLDQWKIVFENNKRKLTVFDKALCLAMALKNNTIFYVHATKGRNCQSLSLLNEKMIVEAVLLYIQKSVYTIDSLGIESNFSLEAFSHKKRFSKLKTLLSRELLMPMLNFDECLAILSKIYLETVVYENNLPASAVEKIKNEIVIKELAIAPDFDIPKTNTYAEFKKSLRNLK